MTVKELMKLVGELEGTITLKDGKRSATITKVGNEYNLEIKEGAWAIERMNGLDEDTTVDYVDEYTSIANM